MFVPSSYDDILQDTKTDNHLVGSAWRFVSIVAVAGFVVSALNYFI